MNQAFPKSFIASKKEGPIRNNGASQGKAKLVANEIRRFTSDRRIKGIAIKEIPGIQGTVAVEFKESPVQLIASGPGDGTDHASRKSPVLSAVGTGDDAKFAHRVHAQ